MKIKKFNILLVSLFVFPAFAGESASSKPLPNKEYSYAGLLCNNKNLNDEPPSSKLLIKVIEIIRVGTKPDNAYDPISAKRVAKAYVYRDRDRGGDCWANIQDEYWEPKNQPK